MPDLKDLYKAAGVSAGVNAASGLASSALSFGFNKLLMKQQNKYAKEMFNLENKRQNWLMLHSAEMQKRALQNAGYSTADPNGTGFSPAPVGNAAAPGTPSMGAVDLGRLDLVQARLATAQAENIEADTAKKRSETKGQDIQNSLNEKFGEKQWTSALENMDADTKKKIEEAAYTTQQKLASENLTKAQVQQIEDNLKMSWIRLDPELQYLCAQVYEAETSASLNRSKASECYQLIRESQQKIQNLKKEWDLTDAEISAAQNLGKLYSKQAATEGWKSIEMRTEAEKRQFELDVQKQLGTGYYKAKAIVNDIIVPTVESANFIGNAVSGLKNAYDPATRKSEVKSTSKSSSYNENHNWNHTPSRKR